MGGWQCSQGSSPGKWRNSRHGDNDDDYEKYDKEADSAHRGYLQESGDMLK